MLFTTSFLSLLLLTASAVSGTVEPSIHSHTESHRKLSKHPHTHSIHHTHAHTGSISHKHITHTGSAHHHVPTGSVHHSHSVHESIHKSIHHSKHSKDGKHHSASKHPAKPTTTKKDVDHEEKHTSTHAPAHTTTCAKSARHTTTVEGFRPCPLVEHCPEIVCPVGGHKTTTAEPTITIGHSEKHCTVTYTVAKPCPGCPCV